MNIFSQLDNMEIIVEQQASGNYIVTQTKPLHAISGYIYKVGKFWVVQNSAQKPIEVARNLQDAAKGFIMAGFPEIKPIFKFYKTKA